MRQTLSAKNSCTSASTFCTLVFVLEGQVRAGGNAQRVLDHGPQRDSTSSHLAALIEKAELHCGPTVRPASDMFLLFVGALEGSVHDYPDVLVWLCETFLLIRVAIEAYDNNSTTPREVDAVNALKREKRKVSSILDPRPSVPLRAQIDTFDSCQ
ncbi:hypothetical protein B0H14DRAFT_3454491 [Mycena olivaceomarginata]|nr:hypothetical protein B0H14DRAFT_3454491 [Mycena olivaceomarginata]